METFLKEKIPSDIVQILKESGFETKECIALINENNIFEIEQYANENKIILRNTSYENIENFKFKPGHKNYILNLPNQIKLFANEQYDSTDFSFMLKNLIETAEQNSKRNLNGFRYNAAIRCFATYIYLHCGKLCYEVLSANLPIPQPSTIGK